MAGPQRDSQLVKSVRCYTQEYHVPREAMKHREVGRKSGRTGQMETIGPPFPNKMRN